MGFSIFNKLIWISAQAIQPLSARAMQLCILKTQLDVTIWLRLYMLDLAEAAKVRGLCFSPSDGLQKRRDINNKMNLLPNVRSKHGYFST